MSRFTAAEVAYLQGQRLGRLATVNEKGDLHVVPVGFRYNPDQETIDIGGLTTHGLRNEVDGASSLRSSNH